MELYYFHQKYTIKYKNKINLEIEYETYNAKKGNYSRL